MSCVCANTVSGKHKAVTFQHLCCADLVYLLQVQQAFSCSNMWQSLSYCLGCLRKILCFFPTRRSTLSHPSFCDHSFEETLVWPKDWLNRPHRLACTVNRTEPPRLSPLGPREGHRVRTTQYIKTLTTWRIAIEPQMLQRVWQYINYIFDVSRATHDAHTELLVSTVKSVRLATLNSVSLTFLYLILFS